MREVIRTETQATLPQASYLIIMLLHTIAFCCFMVRSEYIFPSQTAQRGIWTLLRVTIIHFIASVFRSYVVIPNCLPGSSCIMHLFIPGTTPLFSTPSSSSQFSFCRAAANSVTAHCPPVSASRRCTSCWEIKIKGLTTLCLFWSLVLD